VGVEEYVREKLFMREGEDTRETLISPPTLINTFSIISTPSTLLEKT